MIFLAQAYHSALAALTAQLQSADNETARRVEQVESGKVIAYLLPAATEWPFRTPAAFMSGTGASRVSATKPQGHPPGDPPSFTID